MPYAFTTAWETSPQHALNEAPAYVTAVIATRPTLRRIQMNATTAAGQRLVAAESYYPGWKAFIDGQPVALEEFNGFLSVRTVEGTHEYRFYFDPWLPKVAGLITLLALPYAGWVLIQNRWSFRKQKGEAIPA
jgi:hypothetical protein